MAAIPTWPPFDEQQARSTSHSMEGTPAPATYGTPQQDDLYLQLSQVLHCEIWHHKQTRAELYAEQCRRDEFEERFQQQAQTIAQWEQAYQLVYTSLEGHRTQNATIKREMEAVTAELARMQKGKSDPFVGAEAACGMEEIETSGFKMEASLNPADESVTAHKAGTECDSGQETWRLEFIRDIEEHLRSCNDGGVEVEGGN